MVSRKYRVSPLVSNLYEIFPPLNVGGLDCDRIHFRYATHNAVDRHTDAIAFSSVEESSGMPLVSHDPNLFRVPGINHHVDILREYFNITESKTWREWMIETLKNNYGKEWSTRVFEYARDKLRMDIEMLDDGNVYASDDCCYCENCETHVHSDDSKTVQTQDNSGRWIDQTWCDYCVSNHASTCRRCDCTVAVVYTCGVDGRTWCQDCADNYAYYWESDCEYHQDEESSEEEDANENGELNDYHSGPRPWEGDTIEGEVFGIEFEMEGPERGRSKAIIAAHNRGFICERDSSLNRERGIEVIGAPMPFNQAVRKWSALLAEFRELGCRAWNGSQCGTHISLNKSHYSELTLAKISTFINEQSALSILIAGRETDYASYDKAHKRKDRITKYSGKCHARSFGRGACVIETERVEIRIFRSTLKTESFIKNIEYVRAVTVFAENSLACELTESNFLRYVGHRRDLYPHLAEFLVRKEKLSVSRDEKKKGRKLVAEVVEV